MIRNVLYAGYLTMACALGLSAYFHGGYSILQSIFCGLCWPVFLVMIICIVVITSQTH